MYYYKINWFIITGTRLLNTCPKYFSCGTYKPYWSDDVPPAAVGVPATITAYTVYGPHCRYNPAKLQVMRCSLNTPHDLIYKYLSMGHHKYYTNCRYAFCGML